MRKLGVLTILLVALIVWVTPALAITFGELDTKHTNVGAMVVDFPGAGLVQWCSGTLIHPRVFLTAGHCTDALDDFGITKVWVNFDQYALNSKTLLEVAEWKTHPDFSKGGNASNTHDVAVLILKKPVKKLTPATLPEEEFLDKLSADGKLDGAKFTVVGYGLQEPGVGDDRRRVAASEFQALLKFFLRTSQNRATNDSGTCLGDSGGPAFWTEVDGSEILVGLISWGDSQCKAIGFNYRVDIPETRDFINGVIASLK